MDKNLKLPSVGSEAFTMNPALEKIYKILWAVDPAHIARLKDETLTRLTQINIEYRVKMAKLEAQMKAVEAEALEMLSKEIGLKR
jgi:hypothetical protein